MGFIHGKKRKRFNAFLLNECINFFHKKLKINLESEILEYIRVVTIPQLHLSACF